MWHKTMARHRYLSVDPPFYISNALVRFFTELK
ncbi:protein of unknown function [Methylococcus capsulatus]|jgi:hypothetical protein|uniref:Uncharacterized protein n=1 Tax=Methylococcus capsulatus TaxID=414 RepID=A0AA35UPB4_METCP|nr:protein of unknown function [Methylococcus capsulatus]